VLIQGLDPITSTNIYAHHSTDTGTRSRDQYEYTTVHTTHLNKQSLLLSSSLATKRLTASYSVTGCVDLGEAPNGQYNVPNAADWQVVASWVAHLPPPLG
jgi:hypothetical protein